MAVLDIKDIKLNERTTYLFEAYSVNVDKCSASNPSIEVINGL